MTLKSTEVYKWCMWNYQMKEIPLGDAGVFQASPIQLFPVHSPLGM